MKAEIFIDGFSVYKNSEKVWISTTFENYIVVDNEVIQDPKNKATIVIDTKDEVLSCLKTWLDNQLCGFLLDFDYTTKVTKQGRFAAVNEYEGQNLTYDPTIRLREKKK